MSPNGRILEGIIEREALLVANWVKEMTNGVITRKRTTKNNSEGSVIDFVIISSDILKSFLSMNIDEERKNVLTCITNNKQVTVRQESDHNSIVTNFEIRWDMKKDCDRVEVFKFKDKQGHIKFKELTENIRSLSSMFDTNENIDTQTKSFKEVQPNTASKLQEKRFKPPKDTHIDKLFRKQKRIKEQK